MKDPSLREKLVVVQKQMEAMKVESPSSPSLFEVSESSGGQAKFEPWKVMATALLLTSPSLAFRLGMSGGPLRSGLASGRTNIVGPNPIMFGTGDSDAEAAIKLARLELEEMLTATITRREDSQLALKFVQLKTEGTATISRREETRAALKLALLKAEVTATIAKREETQAAFKLAQLKAEGAATIAKREGTLAARKVAQLAQLKAEVTATIARREETRAARQLAQLRFEGATTIARHDDTHAARKLAQLKSGFWVVSGRSLAVGQRSWSGLRRILGLYWAFLGARFGAFLDALGRCSITALWLLGYKFALM